MAAVLCSVITGLAVELQIPRRIALKTVDSSVCFAFLIFAPLARSLNALQYTARNSLEQ
jgi:hypothetical protein